MGRGRGQIGVGMWCVAAWVVVVLVGVYGAVVFGALGSVGVESIVEGFGLIRARGGGLLVRSVGIAGLIGVLAVLLGIPMARVLISRGKRWVWGVVLVPVWMPSYAIYGAMNLARAPDTIVGRWLVELSTSEPGRRWITIWVGYGIGVVGLALWGAGIAAVVVASGKSGREGIERDMMDLEPAGAFLRARVWVGVRRAALMRAWGVVFVLMLGSGVPLHLAQLDTWSIALWRELAQRGSGEWGVVWVMGLPMVVVGAIGAWLVTRVVVRDATSRGMMGTGVDDEGDERRRIGFLGAGAVWGLAVVVPIVVLGVSIDDGRSLIMFWEERSGALRHSGLVGAVVGVMGCGFAVGVACLLGSGVRWVRRVGVVAVFVSTMGSLVPGVLVGASYAGLIGWADGVVGGLAGIVGEVLGLSARVLVVGGIVGAVVAGRERGELLSQRWSVGGGLSSWWSAHGRTGIAACIGAGVVCGLLAVHEIEAGVMITRAGVSTLSQGLLADLHYARLERLSAALLNLMGLALLISLAAGWLLSRGRDD